MASVVENLGLRQAFLLNLWIFLSISFYSRTVVTQYFILLPLPLYVSTASSNKAVNVSLCLWKLSGRKCSWSNPNKAPTRTRKGLELPRGRLGQSVTCPEFEPALSRIKICSCTLTSARREGRRCEIKCLHP